MALELKDLTEVMEAGSARGVPSPDLLDGVRRRVRRGNRLRAGAAAFGVVLVAGSAFGIVQQDGNARGRHALGPAPTMTGVVNQDFPESAGRDGMQPLKEVRFSTLRAKGRFTVTPTGPFMGVALRCSGDFMVYKEVKPGVFDGGGCSKGSPDDSATSVSKVTPGVPITIEVVAVPLQDSSEQGPNTLSSMADVNRYLGSHGPMSGNWSVRVYSGQCNSDACTKSIHPPTQSKRLPVAGLKRLARVTGTADGSSRTVPLKEPGKSMRMRVTCVDGAAVAVARIGGRTKVVDCESAESMGIVWDQEVEGGTNGIEIAVLPAEAGKVHGTVDAALAKLMKGVKPAGKWTLEVYAH
ncbi:hypothetical protein ACQPZP_34275 [Spirillospora sp. CA-142024]|uniref:hypothetical protein n=1 Tax=Spirillospora sp. CA-142024 TaxID=3240036 RepID=UPI003D8E7231